MSDEFLENFNKTRDEVSELISKQGFGEGEGDALFAVVRQESHPKKGRNIFAGNVSFDMLAAVAHLLLIITREYRKKASDKLTEENKDRLVVMEKLAIIYMAAPDLDFETGTSFRQSVIEVLKDLEVE